MCASFKYEFMYLAIILKSFFSFKCRDFGRVYFSHFLSHFNRVYRLNFNLNFCLCILDDGNSLRFYFSRYFKNFNDIRILLRAFLFGFLTQTLFSNNHRTIREAELCSEL